MFQYMYMFLMLYIFCLVLNFTARCIRGLYKGRSSLCLHSKWDVHQAIQKTNYPKGHRQNNRKRWGEITLSIQPNTEYFNTCLHVPFDIIIWYMYCLFTGMRLSSTNEECFKFNFLLHQIFIEFSLVSAQPHTYSKFKSCI